MVARPWRIMALTLLAGMTVWVWALAGALLVFRWNAIERPSAPARELFPYGMMRVGVDASFPPFAVATAEGLYGLDIDLGQALAGRLVIPVQFINMGYDGLYDSLRADQVDMVISALLVDPARTGDVRYTRSYFNAGLVLITDTASGIDSLYSLSGHTLAYEYGSSADAEARQWLRRIAPFSTLPYELPDYALDAVRLGYAEAALVDASSARLYLREHPDWSAQCRQMTDAWYAIAVRIDRERMWAAVNDALQGMAEDGTLEAILQRWLNPLFSN